jgi:hypothetical protein
LSLNSLHKNIGITHRIEVSNPITLALFMPMHILMPCVDEYKNNNISLLRSKIRELHPVHSASLKALLQHFFRVASHSDKNGATVKILSLLFYKYILSFGPVYECGCEVKARYIDLL